MSSGQKAHKVRGSLWDMGKDLVTAALKRQLSLDPRRLIIQRKQAKRFGVSILIHAVHRNKMRQFVRYVGCMRRAKSNAPRGTGRTRRKELPEIMCILKH